MKLRNLCLMAMFAFASGAYAVGDGGCGLGTLIIKKNTKLAQLGVFTTNYITGGVTFSMTTGTSNCKTDGIVSVDKETIYFVETNQPEISNEIAIGDGEKLETLASMIGCDNAKENFKQTMQSSYGELFPNSNVSAVQLLQNMATVINSNESLASSCSRS